MSAPRTCTNVRDGHFIVPRASPANAITEKKFRGAGAGAKETRTMTCLILRLHDRHNSGRPPVTLPHTVWDASQTQDVSSPCVPSRGAGVDDRQYRQGGPEDWGCKGLSSMEKETK